MATDTSPLIFDDGDVTLIITEGLRFKLHSVNLKRASSYFREKLEEFEAVKLTPKARKDQETPFIFVLVDPDDEEDRCSYFKRVVMNFPLQISSSKLSVAQEQSLTIS